MSKALVSKKSAEIAKKTTGKATKPRGRKTPATNPDASTTISADSSSSIKSPKQSQPIRVVAIGASAGGLEPIEQFFEAMPINSKLAFVIVQHLSPDFRSMMDQLIARHSKMTIVQATHGVEILPNYIYLNPPRTELTISKGKLQTREYSELETVGFPIDSFFRSLAHDQRENAVGIIMSGTGSDGTKGCIEISNLGGTVIAQDPRSSKFDAMPRSVIERNADTIPAFPEDMPGLLKKLIAGQPLSIDVDTNLDRDNPTSDILSMLEERYGADFGYYKQTTVGRRIRRRALLNQIHSLHQYAELLKSDKEELEALYCDLLIGVTAFFRDYEAFDLLRVSALPSVLSNMSAQRQIRVWAPGCASGEEAYSLAIIVSEFARQNDLALNLKIFATDLHFNSLEIASLGIYNKESLGSVPKEIIQRYFENVDGQYQVKQTLRKLVVFSPHNLIKDPPFTRMDLVTCRNLLIYFDDIAQKKVLSFFHFALNKDGILFLGPSETTGELENEFEVISKRWRIFSKKRDIKLREAANLLPLSSKDETDNRRMKGLHENRIPTVHSGTTVAERQLLTRAYDRVLEKYAPASILVDGNNELVHVFGEAKKYLIVPDGLFSRKVYDLIHPDFKLIINAGIERVQASKSAVFRRNVKISLDGNDPVSILITIERLDNQTKVTDHLLITLQAKKPKPQDAPFAASEKAADSSFYSERIKELELDLKATEESLQTTIEEVETSNEELQATNEELMASNEELQSTNEELHSVNEELYTVSSEHQRKIEELTELNSDMSNLFRVTEIGTIFLDTDLKIRRFTPAAAKTFNLVAHDIGRPLDHVTYKFSLPSLISDTKDVIKTGQSYHHEISVDNYSYLLRILPYNDENGEQAGVVLTVVDIHALKSVQHELDEEQKLVANVFDKQSEIIVRSLLDTTITYVNNSYAKYYKSTCEQLVGKKFIDLVPPSEQANVLASFEKLLLGQETEQLREDIDVDGNKRWLHWHRHSITDENGKTVEVQSVGRDVTELMQARKELEVANERLAQEEQRLSNICNLTPVMLHSIRPNGEIIQVSDFWCKKMGYAREDVIGRNLTEFMDDKSRLRAKRDHFDRLFQEGSVENVPFTVCRKDGAPLEIRISAITADDGQGPNERQSFSVVLDVTEQLEAERILEAQNAELLRVNDNLSQFTNIVSHDLTGPLRAIKHTTDWIEQDTPQEIRVEIQEHIDRSKKQIARLSSMLDDLLSYSKAGLTQQDPEKIDLAQEIADIFDVTDKSKNIVLNLGIMPADLFANKAPLVLVFRNLIENAIKYHDRDKGSITIKSSDTTSHWVFTVEDDGRGIDPSMHEKITLPFRKLERKDKVEGNGMGLALVKKAIEANGGELSIKSDPETKRGTSFTFTFAKTGEIKTSAQ